MTPLTAYRSARGGVGLAPGRGRDGTAEQHAERAVFLYAGAGGPAIGAEDLCEGVGGDRIGGARAGGADKDGPDLEQAQVGVPARGVVGGAVEQRAEQRGAQQRVLLGERVFQRDGPERDGGPAGVRRSCASVAGAVKVQPTVS